MSYLASSLSVSSSSGGAAEARAGLHKHGEEMEGLLTLTTKPQGLQVGKGHLKGQRGGGGGEGVTVCIYIADVQALNNSSVCEISIYKFCTKYYSLNLSMGTHHNFIARTWSHRRVWAYVTRWAYTTLCNLILN